MHPLLHLESDLDLRRNTALLAIADAIGPRSNPSQLFSEIAAPLVSALSVDVVILGFVDRRDRTMSLNLWEAPSGSCRLLHVGVDKSIAGAVWKSQNAICVDDLATEKRFSAGLDWLRELEMRSYCVFPLLNFQRRMGTLGFGSKQPRTFGERDFQFLLHVTELLALSADAGLSDKDFASETQKLRLLFHVACSGASYSDRGSGVAAMLGLIQKWAAQDLVGLYVFEEGTEPLRLYMSDQDWATRMAPEGRIPLEDSLTGQTFRTRRSASLDYSSLCALPFASVKRGLELGVRALCLCPVVFADRALGVLKIARRHDRAFSPREVEFFDRIAATIAAVLNRLSAESGGYEAADGGMSFAFPEALLESEELLNAYFSASNVGFGILDTDFRFVAVNETWARMNGISPAQHLRKSIRDVIGGFAEVLESYLQKVVATGQPVTNLKLSFILPRRSDVGHWILHYIPIKDKAGRVTQIGAVVVEITEQKKLEESLRNISKNLDREKMRHEVLTQIADLLGTNLEVQRVFPRISAHLRRVLRQEYAALSLREEGGYLLRPALDFPLGRNLDAGKQIGVAGVPAAKVLQQRAPLILAGEEMRGIDPWVALNASSEGLKSFCWVPLARPKGPLGVLVLGSTRAEAFHSDDLSFLSQVAAQLAISLENEASAREVEQLKQRLKQEKGQKLEKNWLERTPRTHPHFREIIGRSPALDHVLDQIDVVSRNDATVLILGETGTGKGLVAQAIHKTSKRNGRAFVILNCAAIPTGLLESELFGHEKGAFTGAVNQKVGRLELADGGTLFLDEIGEVPLELQPKLLRVLQDHEFERLGGTRTIKVNLRLIAATNRDLAKSVAERQFRSDLFYRLNVFPIRLPALRERREDIPLLAHHFVHEFSGAMGRTIETILPDTMEALIGWHWPGNVRELENFIERSVILTEGDTLIAQVEEFKAQAQPQPSHEQSLERAEREHIISVLRETGGILSGRAGAAFRLGLKRTTLQSKMHRLGIAREDYSA